MKEDKVAVHPAGAYTGSERLPQTSTSQRCLYSVHFPASCFTTTAAVPSTLSICDLSAHLGLNVAVKAGNILQVTNFRRSELGHSTMGLAERCGEIQRGDVLVGVNQYSFRGQSLGDVLHTLSQVSLEAGGITLHFASALSAAQGYAAFRFCAASDGTVTTRPFDSRFGGERVIVSELAVAAPSGASTLSSTVTASACQATRQPVLDFTATHAAVETLSDSSARVSDVSLTWSSQGQTRLATEVDRTIASQRTTKTSLASLLGINMNFFIKWSKGKSPVSASDHAAQVLLAWLASCGKAQIAAACIQQGMSGLARLLDSLRARAALPLSLPVLNVKGKPPSLSTSSSVAARMLHEQDDPFVAPVSGTVVPPHCPGPTTQLFAGSIKVPKAPQRSPSVNGSHAPPLPGEAVSAFPKLPVHRGRRLRPGDTSEVSIKHSRVGEKYQCVVPQWQQPQHHSRADGADRVEKGAANSDCDNPPVNHCKRLPACAYVGQVALGRAEERAVAETCMPPEAAGDPAKCLVPGMQQLLQATMHIASPVDSMGSQHKESAQASPTADSADDSAEAQASGAADRSEAPTASDSQCPNTISLDDADEDDSGSDGDASVRRGKRKRTKRDLTALEAPLTGQQTTDVPPRDGTDYGQPFFPEQSLGQLDLQLLRQEVDDDFRPPELRNRQQHVRPASRFHTVKLTPYGSDSMFEEGWVHQDPTPVGGVLVWMPSVPEQVAATAVATSRSPYEPHYDEVADVLGQDRVSATTHFGFTSPPPAGRKNRTATLASVLPGATSIIMGEAYKNVWASCALHNARYCAEVELVGSGAQPGCSVPMATPLTLLHTNGWFDEAYGAVLAQSIVSCSEPDAGAVATYAPSVGLPGVHVHQGGASAELVEHLRLSAQPDHSSTHSRVPASTFADSSDFAQQYMHHADLAYTVLFCCNHDKTMAAEQLQLIFQAAQAQQPHDELRKQLHPTVAAVALSSFPPVIDSNAWRTWTQKEVATFQDCMDSMGPDMPAISKFVGSRCVRECVQFYYAGFKGTGSSYGIAQGLAEWHGYTPAIWDAAGETVVSSCGLNAGVLAPGTHRSWKRLHTAFASPLVEFHWDVCLVCAQGGNLIMCDSCNLSYHLSCLHVTEDDLDLDAPWACPACALDFNSAAVAMATPFRTLQSQPCQQLPQPESVKMLAVQDSMNGTEAAQDLGGLNTSRVKFSQFASSWAVQHASPLEALREARRLVREGCEAIETTRRNRQRVRGEVIRARSMVRHAELPKDNVLRYVSIQAKRGKKRAAQAALPAPNSKAPKQVHA